MSLVVFYLDAVEFGKFRGLVQGVWVKVADQVDGNFDGKGIGASERSKQRFPSALLPVPCPGLGGDAVDFGAILLGSFCSLDRGRNVRVHHDTAIVHKAHIIFIQAGLASQS